MTRYAPISARCRTARALSAAFAALSAILTLLPQSIPAQQEPSGSRAIVPVPPSSPGVHVEQLYSGSLRFNQGNRSNIMTYRQEPRRANDALVVVTGIIEGPEARVTLMPLPSGYPGYNYSRVIPNQAFVSSRRSAPFRIEFHLPGLSEGIQLRHDGGSQLVIQSVERLSGPGVPRPPAYQEPGYQPPAMPPVRPAPNHRPPQETRPPAPPQPSWPSGWQPAEPTPPPVYQPPVNPWELPWISSFRPYEPEPAPQVVMPVAPPIAPAGHVILYRGEMRIRQNEISRPFIIPAGRSVRYIEIEWTDKQFNATGFLLLNNENHSRYQGYEVESPGVVRWTIRDRVDSFRIQARGDHIWLQSVAIGLDDAAIYRPPGHEGLPPGAGWGAPAPGPVVAQIPGPFHVRANTYSQAFELNAGMLVERIDVRWDDNRRNAVGHLSLGNQPWNARQGADVESPGTVAFTVNERGHRTFRFYARNSDIRILEIRVVYRD